MSGIIYSNDGRFTCLACEKHFDTKEIMEIHDCPMKSVKNPSHYNQGKYEVIDVIADWKLNFNLGNVIKYVARADHKDNALQDIKKALEYLKHEIARREDEK